MSAPLEWDTGTVQINPLKLKPCSALNCTAAIHIRVFWGISCNIGGPRWNGKAVISREKRGEKKNFRTLAIKES